MDLQDHHLQGHNISATLPQVHPLASLWLPSIQAQQMAQASLTHSPKSGFFPSHQSEELEKNEIAAEIQRLQLIRLLLASHSSSLQMEPLPAFPDMVSPPFSSNLTSDDLQTLHENCQIEQQTVQGATVLPQTSLHVHSADKTEARAVEEPEKGSLYKCLECSETFSSKKSLLDHKSVHFAKQSHDCTFCPKKCRLKGNLKKHLQTHFSTTEQLEQHWKLNCSRKSGRPIKHVYYSVTK